MDGRRGRPRGPGKTTRTANIFARQASPQDSRRKRRRGMKQEQAGHLALRMKGGSECRSESGGAGAGRNEEGRSFLKTSKPTRTKMPTSSAPAALTQCSRRGGSTVAEPSSGACPSNFEYPVLKSSSLLLPFCHLRYHKSLTSTSTHNFVIGTGHARRKEEGRKRGPVPHRRKRHAAVCAGGRTAPCLSL